MNGTEFARINGRYSTAFIGTYELTGQNIANNYSTFKLRVYGYYGGGTHTSSSYCTVWISGTEYGVGSYTLYPGYRLLAEKDITVYHNNDGSFPYNVQAIGINSYHASGEASGALSAPSIPRQANITGYWDFNDEGNPRITYTNPGGFRINTRIEFGGTSIRRDNIPSTGSYTFELTTAERALLREKCTSNAMTVRGVIATCIGGTTENYWSYWDRTMTMVNANPVFSNFTFQDINPTTLALTGNNQDIIRNYSNVQVTIPVTDKAEAVKSATMSKYRFACGDLSTDITFSNDSDVSGTTKNVPNGTFNVYATDSRTNSTLVTKLASTVKDYTALTKGNIDVVRSNGVSEETTLTLSGTIDLIDFGQVVNSIKTAKYRYKATSSSTWSNYIDITLTVDDKGNFSFSDEIEGDEGIVGFNISNSYNVEVLIEDELSSVTYTDTLNSGIPNLALAKNGVGIMGKYDDSVGGELQIKGQKVLTPYTLYDNSSGTTGSVTLNETSANFSYIEIFFSKGANDSVKVTNPNGQTVALLTGYPLSNTMIQIQVPTVLISANTITKNNLGLTNIASGSNPSVYNTNEVSIKKVIGYK